MGVLLPPVEGRTPASSRKTTGGINNEPSGMFKGLVSCLVTKFQETTYNCFVSMCLGIDIPIIQFHNKQTHRKLVSENPSVITEAFKKQTTCTSMRYSARQLSSQIWCFSNTSLNPPPLEQKMLVITSNWTNEASPGVH